MIFCCVSRYHPTDLQFFQDQPHWNKRFFLQVAFCREKRMVTQRVAMIFFVFFFLWMEPNPLAFTSFSPTNSDVLRFPQFLQIKSG